MRLKEKKDTCGWDKETVRYATQNRKHIYKVFKNSLRTSPQLLSSDTLDDIWGEFMERLYKSPDYDPKAADKGITLDGYVGKKAQHCALTHINKLYKDNSFISHFTEISTEDDETLSLLDIIADPKAEEAYKFSTCALIEILKSIEPYRYIYGVDLFLFLYIRLQGLDEEKVQQIFETLDIASSQITMIKNQMLASPRIKPVIEEISAAGDSALKTLSAFIYDKRGVDKCIYYIVHN